MTRTYLNSVLIIFAIVFVVTARFTVYEWTTSQDIPLIEALLSPGFLQNDFYTQSVLGSPRLFFVLPFITLEKIGIPWQNSLYFFKTLLFLLFPLVIFEIVKSAFEKVHIESKVSIRALLVFVILSLGIDVIGFFWNKGGPPIGWISITSIKTIIPMTLSTFFGAIYILVNKKIYSVLLLIVSTLIHPVMGLAIFSVFQLFNFAYLLKDFPLKKFLLQLLVGVFLPLILLKLNYSNNVLSAEDFIEHYVYLRHPHHYSILESFNFKTGFFGFFAFLPIYLYRKNNLLLRLSIAGSLVFFGSLLLQFVGVEFLHLKSLAIVGPSRVSTFCALILFIQYTYIVLDKFGDMKFIKALEKRLKNLYDYIDSLKITKINPYLLAVCLSLVISIATFKNPIIFYKKGKFMSVASWVDQNINESSTFFLGHKIDSFIFRSYAKRAVYADMAFPFNEKYVQEFSKRYLIYKKTKSFTWNDYRCLRSKTDVDYLLIRNVDAKNFPKEYVLYQDKKYSVYDIPKIDNCDLKKLISEYEKYKDYLRVK